MAIFMSVFLFFLSVALVAQNRMDITLALSVDHRLQAQMAARAATNYGLAVMRSEPDWEAKLTGASEEIGTGSWELEVHPYADPDGSPYLYELVGTGRAGPVTRVRKVVVEEVRMARARDDGLQPHFFSYSKNDELIMLTPDFRWHSLGAVPRKDAPLSASGGPLFSFGPPDTAERPPAILSTLPFFDESGEAIDGPQVRLEICPPGEHLVYLNLDGGVTQWVDIPEPGPQLGSWNGLVEDSDGTRTLPRITLFPEDAEEAPPEEPWHKLDLQLRGKTQDGRKVIESIEFKTVRWKSSYDDFTADLTTKPWSSAWDIAKSPEELTITWEEITEPKIYLNWYSLDGKGLAARGDKVYSHATHYFYGHVDMRGEQKEFGTPLYESIVYQSPAVLCYDISDEKWSVVTDMLRVNEADPSVTPQVLLGPEGDKSVLVATESGELYTFHEGDERGIVKAVPQGFNRVSSQETPVHSLVAYRDKIFYWSQAGYWDFEHRPRLALTALEGGQVIDPAKGLAYEAPEVIGKIPGLEGGLEDRTMVPRTTVSLGLAGSGQDVTVWDGDLYCATWIRRHAVEPTFATLGHLSELPDYTHQLTVLRFDGEHWQVWPGGLRQHLLYQPNGDLLSGLFEALDAEEKAVTIKPTLLAAAAYKGDFASARRYAVVSVTESASE